VEEAGIRATLMEINLRRTNYAVRFAVCALGRDWDGCRKQIPELESEPVRIWFHIAAEMVTAVCLISAGIALLSNTSWAVQLYLVALGMLFYTSIVSPGYFAQRGQWGWLGMFAGIIILGLVSITFVL